MRAELLFPGETTAIFDVVRSNETPENYSNLNSNINVYSTAKPIMSIPNWVLVDSKNMKINSERNESKQQDSGEEVSSEETTPLKKDEWMTMNLKLAFDSARASSNVVS